MIQEENDNNNISSRVQNILWGMADGDNINEAAKQLKDATGNSGYTQYLSYQRYNITGKILKNRKRTINLEFEVSPGLFKRINTHKYALMDVLSAFPRYKACLSLLSPNLKSVKVLSPSNMYKSTLRFIGLTIFDKNIFVPVVNIVGGKHTVTYDDVPLLYRDVRRFTNGGNLIAIGTAADVGASNTAHPCYVHTKSTVFDNMPNYSYNTVRLNEKTDYYELYIEATDFANEEWEYTMDDRIEKVKIQVEMEYDLSTFLTVNDKIDINDPEMLWVVKNEFLSLNFIRPLDKTIIEVGNLLYDTNKNTPLWLAQYDLGNTISAKINQVAKKWDVSKSGNLIDSQTKVILQYYDSFKSMSSSILKFFTSKPSPSKTNSIIEDVNNLKKLYLKISSPNYNETWNRFTSIYTDGWSPETVSFCRSNGKIDFSFLTSSVSSDIAIGLATLLKVFQQYNNDILVPIDTSVMINKIKESIEISKESEIILSKKATLDQLNSKRNSYVAKLAEVQKIFAKEVNHPDRDMHINQISLMTSIIANTENEIKLIENN